MRQEQIYEDDVDQNGYRGPSKSQLKREQNALQDLGREMTKLGDEPVSYTHLTLPTICSV